MNLHSQTRRQIEALLIFAPNAANASGVTTPYLYYVIQKWEEYLKDIIRVRKLAGVAVILR